MCARSSIGKGGGREGDGGLRALHYMPGDKAKGANGATTGEVTEANLAHLRRQRETDV